MISLYCILHLNSSPSALLPVVPPTMHCEKLRFTSAIVSKAEDKVEVTTAYCNDPNDLIDILGSPLCIGHIQMSAL